ncbi:hypothetical protein DFS34DRAFT_116945 [Phlyctochytrium arcticum]|nr:hypothetical protein DFS34DRAFT_116945 [Phlyctochytrium arcticum]
MLEKLIAPVINKILGDYVGNLESKQLNIGIWQGDVALHNLKLRKDALDKFNLPIDVREGYLGDLNLSIPWNDLKNKPVKISINRVYLLACPKSAGVYDPIEEDERLYQGKLQRLATTDLIMTRKRQGGETEDKQQESTFATRLITKILDNVQITMKDIHICYEDTVSNPGHPFSIGLTLEELSAVSCDGTWTPTFVHEDTDLIRKLAKLGSLAVYFNTHAESLAGKSQADFMNAFRQDKEQAAKQYILTPVSGVARLETFKHQPADSARHTAWLEFDELGFVLDQAQFKNAISLLGTFSSYMKAQKYRRYRPPMTVTPKMDPAAWFKFAGTCVLKDIHERHAKWTWQYFATRRDDRLAYLKLYKELKEGLLVAENKTAFDELERKLSFEDIVLYRSIALSRLRKKAIKEAEHSVVPKKQEPATIRSSWSSWWNGTAANQEQSQKAETAGFLSDEQMKQLYDTIEFDPNSASAVVELPKDAKLIRIESQLRRGSLSLKESLNSDNILSLVFEYFTAHVTQYVNSMTGDMSLGNMLLQDGTTSSTLYPNLIQPKRDTAEELGSSLFRMEFEHNPLDERADDAVSFVMLPLQIIYAPTAIRALVDFFSIPSDDMQTVSDLQAVAQDTFEGLTAQAKAGLQAALEQHKTVDLKVDFAAPIFVFPQDYSSDESMVLLVDTGHLILESIYVNKKEKAELHARQGNFKTATDLGEISSLLYDRFSCQLSDLQVLIGPSLGTCLEGLKGESSKQIHFIEKVNLQFDIDMCILPNLIDYPRFKVSGSLPRLHVNLSDRKYKTMMSIVDMVLGKSDEKSLTQADQLALPAVDHWKAAPIGGAVVYDDGDSFYDAPEISNVNNNAKATPSLNEEEVRKLVDLSFVVHQASASLLRSHTDRTRDERELANLMMDNFDINVLTMPMELNVKIRIRAITIEDKLQVGNSKFTYLLAPTLEDEARSVTSDISSVDQLIRVNYKSINPLSSNYNGVNQLVEISFAAVSVVLTRASVLELYDFILVSFTSPAPRDATKTSTQKLSDDKNVSDNNDNDKDDESNDKPTTGAIVVKAAMRSMSFILNEDGEHLSTIRLGALSTDVELFPTSMTVSGSVGDATVVDERPNREKLFRHLLDIEGEELAHFMWKTYDSSAIDYPGFDSSLMLHASSMKFTFMELLLRQLLDYFSKFKEMHVFFETARRAAISSAQQIQESAGRFHYDIKIESPILMLPRPNLTSNDMLIVYPGMIAAKNSFCQEYGKDVDDLDANVQSIRITSSSTNEEGEELQRCILDDVHVDINMRQRLDNVDSTLPGSILNAEVSPVQVTITQDQYALVLELVDSVNRFLAVDTTSESEVQSDSDTENSLEVAGPSTVTTRDFKVRVPSISLEICKVESASKSDSDKPLAEFALKGALVKYAVDKDSVSTAELQIKTFAIRDCRSGTSVPFQSIMPPSTHEENQLLVHFRSDQNKSSTLATLTRPTILLVPDHIFAVRDFFAVPSGDIRVATKESSEDSSTGSASRSSSFRFDLVEVELILLHNPSSISSEAITLSSKHVTISQEHVMTIGVKELGMYLCEMDRREETTVPFIQNFDITVCLDDRTTNPGHTLTNYQIDLSPAMFRVSYRDILLIMDIFARINSLFMAGNETASAKSEEDGKESVQEVTQVVMKRERLHANVQGLRIILIDDLNDLHLPMLDIILEKFALDVADWSSSMRAQLAPAISCNFFNVKNSHWEPFIEPWQFAVHFGRQSSTGALSLDFAARKRLEINVTHTLVETVLGTQHQWSKQEQRHLISRRGAHSPYVIRNQTGYDMYVWADTTENALDTELQQLPNGEEMPWRFENWRMMRERTVPIANKLSLQINGPSWETMKSIAVDREGVKIYMLRPAINRVAHRLVCEVKLKDNVKYVTFRSTFQVENTTQITLEVVVVNNRRQRLTSPTAVAPGQFYNVPIEAAFYESLQIRPQEGFGYDWSNEILFWKDLAKQPVSLVTCRSLDPTAPPFRFQTNCVYTTGPKDSKYPMMTARVLPPFQLENLLPYDIRYTLHDKTARQQHTEFLRCGAVQPIHTVDPSHLLALGVEILNSVYRAGEVAIITNSELDYRDDTLKFTDPSGQPLHLRIKYHDKLDTRGRTVAIYSPYVLLNKTGLDIIFSTRSLLGVSRFSSPKANANSKEVTPLLFSFPNFEPLRSRVQAKVASSEPSKPISFDAVGSSFEVMMQSSKDRTATLLGATIREGEGKYYMTKTITFSPRFILKNALAEDLQIKQPGSNNIQVIGAGDRIPLHTFHLADNHQTHIAARLTGLMNEWSNPMDITQIGRMFLKMGRMSSPEHDLIRVEILLDSATIFVLFAAKESRWPFRLENRIESPVEIWQRGAKTRSHIPAGESRPYSWDFPSAEHKALILNAGGRERELDVLEMGQLVPFKYPGGIMSIQVFVEGPTIVIKLTPYVESRSVFKKTRRSHSVTSETDQKEIFQMKTKETKMLHEVQIRLEGIGVSIINMAMQELLYASIKNLTFALTDSTTNQALTFGIKWLQIDNQLYEGLEPIFLYPTVIPKEGEEDYHPVLMMSLSRSKDPSYGVEYFDWFTILLQELSVDMDEEFLGALIKFSKFNVPGWDEEKSKLCDLSLVLPEPPLSHDENKLYFETFLLQPVQINVSFVKTQSVNMEEARPRQHGVLTFVLDILTMTLGNIHDAPVRLNALELKHANITLSQLLDFTVTFYSQEVIGQVHKVIGSADFLGNPVGLFNNVSSGVSDLFYEPLQGFEITRPQDFGIGVAKGTASLFVKTVFGVSDTFSKFTGSLGKGLSVITMDNEFQQRRRLSSIRNRPRHAVYGVTTGATSFARSFASGITGVVSKPLEGAQEEGVGGFFKGLGKGIVGAVTKPVIGVIDLATNVGEGIRNTTTVFDADLDRQRLPRFIGRDGILTSYDPREALGVNWLKGLENGKYFNDEYIAHLDHRVEDIVTIVSNNRIINARVKKLKSDWDIPFEDLQLVQKENGSITLIKRNRQNAARARIVSCPDAATTEWFCKIIESAFADFLERTKSYE